MAAVSATVMAWNPFTNLCSLLQAYEYRQTIFISACHADAWEFWASSPEPSSVSDQRRQTTRRCWTSAPAKMATWFCAFAKRLQSRLCSLCKLLYERSDIMGSIVLAAMSLGPHGDHIRMPQACRYWLSVNEHFQWSNMALMLERWIFNVVCVFTFWLYGAWFFIAYPEAPSSCTRCCTAAASVWSCCRHSRLLSTLTDFGTTYFCAACCRCIRSTRCS